MSERRQSGSPQSVPNLERRLHNLESFTAGLGPVLNWIYEAMHWIPGGGHAPGGGGGGGGHAPGGGGGGGGQGGGVGTGVLAGRALNHCEWVQVWANGTGGPKDRTTDVKPAAPPNGFPPGSTITVFVGPNPAPAPGGGGRPQNGGPPAPPAAPAGSPPGQWPTIPNDGGSAGLNVPPGQALYVHYDKGQGNQAGIRALITQSS